MSQCPEERVGAEISHSMALLLSAAPQPRHNGAFIQTDVRLTHTRMGALSGLNLPLSSEWREECIQNSPIEEIAVTVLLRQSVSNKQSH